ncbi:MAG: M14 family metallopeptidase, partial [Myxococcota bacterium]|nr:M14 family metallopeptidase [Myxococcota bacterium]
MFEETYEAARDAFRELVLAGGGELESLSVCEGEAAAADGSPLTIDVGVIGLDAPRALLTTSGVHGIEGFAGSACQRHMLSGDLRDDVRYVMVHAVNPYGMAKIRRVNERNVDLNRNFLSDGEAYSGCNQGYRDLEDLLNPDTPHGGFEAFLLRAGWLILRHGMPALRQAVAEGQYDYPRGLFWGGDSLETSAH